MATKARLLDLRGQITTLQAAYDVALARGDPFTARRIFPTLAALNEDALRRTALIRAILGHAPEPYRSIALQAAHKERQYQQIRARFTRRAVSATLLAIGVEGPVQGGD
jgi:hypothetical protein